MADDVITSNGTIAADDIGSVYYQRVKLSQGVDGSGTDVSSAAPLNVTTANYVPTITPTISATIYGTEEVLFDATQIASVTLISGKPVTLVSLCLIDQAEQGGNMWIIFFDRSVSFGTANGAVSTSDADAANFVGQVYVDGEDWVDIGGAMVATANFAPIEMKPNATDLYVAGKTLGTQTYGSTSALILKPGFAR